MACGTIFDDSSVRFNKSLLLLLRAMKGCVRAHGHMAWNYLSTVGKHKIFSLLLQCRVY